MQEQLRQVPGRAMIFMPLSMLFAYRTVFAVTPTDQFESHISKPQDGSPWRTRSERRTFRLFPTSWFDRNMMTILKCVDTCLLLIPAMSLDTRLLGDRTWWLLFVCVNARFVWLGFLLLLFWLWGLFVCFKLLTNNTHTLSSSWIPKLHTHKP